MPELSSNVDVATSYIDTLRPPKHRSTAPLHHPHQDQLVTDVPTTATAQSKEATPDTVPRITSTRLLAAIKLCFSKDFIDPIESDGIWVFRCVLFSSFFGAFDNTILAAISANIATDLGARGVLPWIISSYSIAQSAASPLTVVISSKSGRRPVLLISVTLFFLGTLMCCFDFAPKNHKPVAKWAPVVIGRLVSGFGADGMSALPNVIVNDKAGSPGVNVPRRMQATNFIYNFAAAIGSPICGIMTQKIGWRNVFRLQLGIVLTTLFVVFWGVRETRQEEDKESRAYDPLNSLFPDSLWEVDWLGGTLLFVSTASLLVALTLGTDILSWDNFITWIMFGVAFISFVLLTGWELILDKHMVKRRRHKRPNGFGARVSLPIIELRDFTWQTTPARVAVSSPLFRMVS